MSKEFINVVGACQNNLKQIDLKLPLNEFIVITGVSGSGKSSLAFDTIYSEGQRRYVETFSPYARQFLDRMDKPRAERIEGIPPAIAIDQTNPVRTSRSTVGTMTEINDHLKLLFARMGQLYCRRCALPVRRDSVQSIQRSLLQRAGRAAPRAIITFPLTMPGNFSEQEILSFLKQQGYTRIHQRDGQLLHVTQDRLKLQASNSARLAEALEAALHRGHGRVNVFLSDSGQEALRFSTALHCAACDIHYESASAAAFSFNSPVGACDSCRGFGRTMGIDYQLVVPDGSLSLAEGAIKPFQSPSYLECQKDLQRYARSQKVALDVPWSELPEEHRQWVLEGEGDFDSGRWYGVSRFFQWLESKSYKMHIRVLLSKYRSYDVCPRCRGSRLKHASLLWRVGDETQARTALGEQQAFLPPGTQWNRAQAGQIPGLCLHDVMGLPILRALDFFSSMNKQAALDEATAMLLGEIRSRLAYLCEVGLGYLTLDRQSRTLSGGEVQRINLTTALGTSLVNTLFVLDEPSIGLHSRDISRIVAVLRRLQQAGNTLLVVEHDPQLMLAADRIVDMGPGPGQAGGRIVFNGSPSRLLSSRRSRTAAFLRGERKLAWPSTLPAPDHARSLAIRGARAHNLKNLDLDIPLGRLVCLTGVSGSGKSTLMEDVLYYGLLKLKGRPKDQPGAHDEIRGQELIEDVVLVDQSPIGKTTRSNPASFVGALDPIRKLFAGEPLARERGYTPGSFSFNSGNGRCPGCGGNGFEHVEMQFLSDVYLRCPDCDGRRYRDEILEVKLLPGNAGRSTNNKTTPRSIADVLAMTVDQALDFFASHGDILKALEPLTEVGLGYVTLGQPVPTLSGGEAQRLKLAAQLAKSAGGSTPGKLFLFDEPTTGLHFEDIERLLGALRRLQAQGHSLLVIEHNLDVIAAADWVIDLGPEGGEEGGRLQFQGSPRSLAGTLDNHTGKALADYARELARLGRQSKRPSPAKPPPAKSPRGIRIRHAREHNLKNVNLDIPRDKMTVVTGVSGSGKSTVAFDILFAEGQRRYLESLNAYARQFVQPASRPDVDAIHGIPPTVAIEQRTSRGGRKSTVGTLTEIYHFLRLLFVKLGIQHCPDCDVPIQAQSPESIIAEILRRYRGKTVRMLAPLVVSRKGFYTDLAKWAAARGFEQLRVDGELTPSEPWPRLDRFREHDIDLPIAQLGVSANAEQEIREALGRGLELGKGVVRIQAVAGKGKAAAEHLYSSRRACPSCSRSFAELDPRLFSYNSRHGWCPQCFGTGQRLPEFDAEQTGEESWWLEASDAPPCPACQGQRLRPEALAVRFQGKSISHFTALDIEQAQRQLNALRLAGRDAHIARDALKELLERLDFLQQVGLSYLSLDRSAPTLSGGEAQRIRLAAQLGSNLRGVCYILDEPTIGLHARDNRMLLDTLQRLRDKGNTVVVVEHDEDTIRRADHVIDLGPGAGVNGGKVVAKGTLRQLQKNPRSITGRMLAQPMHHPMRGSRRLGHRLGANMPALHVCGASAHNLRSLDLRIPLGALVCVTGVSGSGKSTLVRDVVFTNLQPRVGKKRSHGRAPAFRGCSGITGWGDLQRVLEVDQAPIGKTPRSCPATYVGIWDEVRKLFAKAPEARLRGFAPGRFSFNTPGGRCATCEGQGMRKIEMNFLPDVRVDCEGCNGARFNTETLEIEYRGRNIAQVLAMSVDEAVEFFAAHERIHHSLQLLQDVGLGYLTLGQQSPTLSGGEAQRIKLVTELAKARPAEQRPGRPAAANSTLYVLDEPTVGLHMADVEKLVHVLHRLVDAGNSVLVIEHNLDLAAEADWIVDMGPEGGDGGGRVVSQGPPEKLVRCKRSHTAAALAPLLARST